MIDIEPHGQLWASLYSTAVAVDRQALNNSRHSDIKELHSFFHHIDFVQAEMMDMVDSIKR